MLGDNSELAELWREAGEEDVWRARVAEVEAVLVSPPIKVGDSAVGSVSLRRQSRARESSRRGVLDEGERLYEDSLHEQAIERFDLGIAPCG